MGDLIPAAVTPTPAVPAPVPAPAVPIPAPAEPAPAPEVDGFKSKESKDAVLADLAETRKELAAFKEREAAAEKAKLSDIERANAETAERAKEAAEAKAELSRYKVAAKHGITDADDLELLATASDEATMERLAARIAPASAPGTPKPDPSSGPKKTEDLTVSEQATAAEKAGDRAAAGRLKALQLGALANN